MLPHQRWGAGQRDPGLWDSCVPRSGQDRSAGPWPLGWPAWSLSEPRGRHCPGRPSRASRGGSLEVIAFSVCAHTHTGPAQCQHAGHLCWPRRSLPVADGRPKSRRAETATREGGEEPRGAPCLEHGPQGPRAQGGRPPRRRALPALLVDRALAGSGPGPGAACWGPGPARLSPGAAPFVAPPPASVALGRGGSGTVRQSGAGVAGAGAAAGLSAPASPAGQALSPLLTWVGGAHLSPWHSQGASGMGATGRPGLGREAELPPCLGRVWVFSATRTPRPQTGH